MNAARAVPVFVAPVRPRITPKISAVVGLICVLAAPLWVYELFFAVEDQPVSDFALVPAIIAANLILVSIVARRDQGLSRVLPVAFLFKIVCVAAYLYMTFGIFGGSVDLVHYYGQGLEIANAFHLRGEWTTLQPFWSNNFIYMITGGLFIVIGPSLVAGSMIFAMVAFWGQYLFYRAFCQAFPQGDRDLAMSLLLFLPSIVFWPAVVGKDAIIFFCIAMASYGFVLLQVQAKLRSIVLMAGGLGGTMLVRPHIAAMLGMAMFVPYVLGKNRKGVAQVAGKLLALPLFLGGIYYLAGEAQSFLQMEDFSKAGKVMERVASGSATGGSQFSGAGSFLLDILNSPFLLFRPFPWEVRSAQAAVAGAEALLLLYLILRQRRVIRAAVVSWRQNAVVLFIVLYAVQFSVVFAISIRNFGLLARERVMLVPLVVLLLCFRPSSAVQFAQQPGRRWHILRRRHPAGVGPSLPARRGSI